MLPQAILLGESLGMDTKKLSQIMSTSTVGQLQGGPYRATELHGYSATQRADMLV